MATPPPAMNRRPLTPSSITAICLLAVIIVSFALAGIKIKQHDDFTRQAFQVMDSFAVARATGRGLEGFEAPFAQLAGSDRALGRMLAIAYLERTESLQARDQAIVAAVNQLKGGDLFRLLSAAAPMFDAKARESYIAGGSADFGFPGVNMMFNSLDDKQRAAMHNCFKSLQPIYSNGSLEGRMKVATTLYTGKRWESCSVPAPTRYDRAILDNAI